MMNNGSNLNFFDEKENNFSRGDNFFEAKYDSKQNLEDAMSSTDKRIKYHRHSLHQIQNLEEYVMDLSSNLSAYTFILSSNFEIYDHVLVEFSKRICTLINNKELS